MDGRLLFLIEAIGIFGVVLGWALWELRSLRRSQAEDRRKAEARDVPITPPE
jgi:hypothetical protein